MNKQMALPISQDKIANFCQWHYIRRLAFLGSVLRDDFDPENDVYVLVEFEPGTKVSFFELYDSEQELSQILGGYKVEINMPKSLRKYFRDEVLEEAEVQYVQTRPACAWGLHWRLSHCRSTVKRPPNLLIQARRLTTR